VLGKLDEVQAEFALGVAGGVEGGVLLPFGGTVVLPPPQPGLINRTSARNAKQAAGSRLGLWKGRLVERSAAFIPDIRMLPFLANLATPASGLAIRLGCHEATEILDNSELRSVGNIGRGFFLTGGHVLPDLSKHKKFRNVSASALFPMNSIHARGRVVMDACAPRRRGVRDQVSSLRNTRIDRWFAMSLA